MLAFAANSILCRMALLAEEIDASTFTLVRLLTGTGMLLVLTRVNSGPGNLSLHWPSAVLLFSYMGSFSYGYLELSAGVGALILFGAVQLTMLGYAAYRGERFTGLAWIGITSAAVGLAFLLAPGGDAPNLKGALLMVAAGVSWGAYSLLGRNLQDPLGVTAGNFLLASVMAVGLWLPIQLSGSVHSTINGLVLAASSGVLASAVGYALWFAALKQLTASTASVVQLSVPVIAGVGGFILLLEPPGFRFVAASIGVLGGIWMVLYLPKQRLVQ